MEFNSTPMLRLLTLPASWFELLQPLRPVFRRSSTFGLFVLLATGLVAQTTRRTVVGHARRRGDGRAGVVPRGVPVLLPVRLGHRSARAAAGPADRGPAAAARTRPIEVVVDDTLFRRWGPKVFGAFWTHDGSAQGPNALGRGNRWVIVGIVVRLPFCAIRCACRCCCGSGAARAPPPRSQLAGELIIDSGPSLSGPTRSTSSATPPTTASRCWCRAPRSPPGCPANAALLRARAAAHRQAAADPRRRATGSARPAEIAATAPWRRVTVDRYGRSDTVEIAVIDPIWYGAVRQHRPAAPSWSANPATTRRCWRSSPPTPTAAPRPSSPATPHRWP